MLEQNVSPGLPYLLVNIVLLILSTQTDLSIDRYLSIYIYIYSSIIFQVYTKFLQKENK